MGTVAVGWPPEHDARVSAIPTRKTAAVGRLDTVAGLIQIGMG
jgi:hypothetical protein